MNEPSSSIACRPVTKAGAEGIGMGSHQREEITSERGDEAIDGKHQLPQQDGKSVSKTELKSPVRTRGKCH
jgi:hypothetical protein